MAERGIQFPSLEKTLRNPEKIKNDPVGLFLEQCNEVRELSGVTANKADFSYLSAEQRAESLWAIFQELKGIKSGRKKKI